MSDIDEKTASSQKPDTAAIIQKLLDASKAAKPVALKNLLDKINSGEIPSAAELKLIDNLAADLDITSPDETEKEDEYFPSLLAVATYLRKSGWKLSQAAIYNHATQRKIRPRGNGLYSKKDVDKYANLYLKRLDGTGPEPKNSRIEGLQTERTEAEVVKLKAQAEYWQGRNRDTEKEILARIGEALAARLRILKSDYRNFTFAQAYGIAEKFGIDPKKVPDLIVYLQDTHELHLDRYARIGENDRA